MDDASPRGPARYANGRFGPGHKGRPRGARGRMSRRVALSLLGHFEANQAAILQRLTQYFLTDYMGLIGRMLPKDPDEVDLGDLPPREAAITARAKGEVAYADGSDPAAAAALAKGADVAIVFATQWNSEGVDGPLALEGSQDALIEAVAAANPHTIVVLETGNPVLMPWLGKVQAALEAWYPGARGGEALAKVLYGEVDAAGRLPISFPRSEDQLPRPELPGLKNARPEGATTAQAEPPFDVQYAEGSDVGYRWYAAKGLKPLFPFGYGLSYTGFRYADLKMTGGQGLSVGFTLTNTGKRAGTETPQLYLASGPHRTQQRLLGFSRVALKPGESRRVMLTADPRLLMDWDEKAHGWKRDAGRYRVFVGMNAEDGALQGEAALTAAKRGP